MSRQKGPNLAGLEEVGGNERLKSLHPGMGYPSTPAFPSEKYRSKEDA